MYLSKIVDGSTKKFAYGIYVFKKVYVKSLCRRGFFVENFLTLTMVT